MSDRAPLALVIYTCPDQATADIIIDTLNDLGLEEEAWDHPRDPMTFTTGMDITKDNAGMGLDDEVANRLCNLGVAFTVYQEWKREHPAMTTLYTPELGSYNMTGDDEGNVMIAAVSIDQIVHGDGMPGTKFLALDRLTGKAHRDAIEELKTTAEEVTWTRTELPE